MRRLIMSMASGPTTAGTKVKEERQICVYRADALFSFIYRHQEQCTPLRVLLFYFCVFIGVKVALAAYSRVLWAPGLEQVVVADFHRYPPFSLLLGLGRFLKFTPADIAPLAPSPAVVPYLRDYTEIFVMAVMAVQMVLIGRLWRNLSVALDQLYKDGILAISKERWVRLSRKYDKLYNLRLPRVAAMVGAIALIIGIHYSAWVHGIYERLGPSNDPTWAHVAYTNWWANPASHPTLFFYSLAVAIFLCYYNLRNSIAGIITVLFCWEIFSGRRDGYEQVLILDTAHRDGLGGVGILKEMLSLAFQQVSISFVSLSLIYCCFGLQRALVPLYSAFILLPPLQLLLVLIPISKQVRESKSLQVIGCRRELEAITRMVGSRAYIRLVREPTLREIERLGEIPDLLFSFSKVVSWAFAYYIPAVLFVDWAHKL